MFRFYRSRLSSLSAANREQHISPERLVARLNRQDMVGRSHCFVKVPLQNRAQCQLGPTFFENPPVSFQTAGSPDWA